MGTFNKNSRNWNNLDENLSKTGQLVINYKSIS